jgi:hypothetical protein
MKYRVAFLSPLDGKVYLFKRVYSDLISAMSAADDYNVGEPCIQHWVEPEPSSVSNDEIEVSQNFLSIQNENLIQFKQ